MSVYSALRDFVFSPKAARLIGEPFFFLMGMRKGSRLDLKKVRRVLVVKLDEIGDAVMLTPFIRELRAGLPQAAITLVVKPQLKDIWELCPYINEVITYDRRTGPPNLHSHSSALSFAKGKLWKKRFDLAIVPRWDADYYGASFLAYFSGASVRIGYRHKEIIGAEYDFDSLYTYLLTIGSSSIHEVEKNTDLLRFLKIEICNDELELWLDKTDLAYADAAFDKRSSLKIVFGIGAASDKRIWPIDNFLELAKRLKLKSDMDVVILGGEKEREAGNMLVKQAGDSVINLAGKTTLRQAAAVLKKSAIYVGNDSGLMHVAAAVGTPVVEISCHPVNGDAGHYNSPSRFGPWGIRKIILQPERAIAPCYCACTAEQAHCIRGVSVAEVQAALTELINPKYV